jgi:hypothetical protein
MLITPLKLARYTGNLAKYNNFGCVIPDIQSFIVRPIKLERIAKVETRGYHKISKYKNTVIINKETGIIFNNITKVSETLNCSRNCVSVFLRLGRASGWVNPETKDFIQLSRREATRSRELDLIDDGYVKAHWVRVKK